jgi:Mn-dependent DtxR family transcriptional regulator
VSLQESGEMYLETIFLLTKRSNKVRAIDICEYMGFSKPSVSRAVNLLKKGGFIKICELGHITLTESGLDVAQKIYDRHQLLTSFLIKLGVNKDVASKDACKMEHCVSDETFTALKNFIEKN